MPTKLAMIWFLSAESKYASIIGFMSYNFGFALSYLITPLVIKGVDMPKLNLSSSFAIIDPIRTQREILKLNIPVAAVTILARRS